MKLVLEWACRDWPDRYPGWDTAIEQTAEVFASSGKRVGVVVEDRVTNIVLRTVDSHPSDPGVVVGGRLPIKNRREHWIAALLNAEIALLIDGDYYSEKPRKTRKRAGRQGGATRGSLPGS